MLDTMLPPPPAMPSDWLFLLTYTAGSEESLAAVVAEHEGIDLDGSTQVDELAA
jgi:hypothetical protein